jgi:hypothetical protein
MNIKKFLRSLGIVGLCAMLVCSISTAQEQKKQKNQQESKQQLEKQKIDRQQQLDKNRQLDPQQTVRGTIKDRIPPFKPSVKGIDPAVTYFQAVMKRKIPPHRVEIAIRGVVQNIGNKDFSSGPNQQSVRLVQKTPGVSGEQVLITKKFKNLKSGKKITVEHVMTWTPSIEFPPDYYFRIDYDPDILIDGNANNDDVKMNDNYKMLAGATISNQCRDYLDGKPPAAGKGGLQGQKGTQKTFTSRNKKNQKGGGK